MEWSVALGLWLCSGWSKTVYLKVKNKDEEGGETRITQSPLQEQACSGPRTSHKASPLNG